MGGSLCTPFAVERGIMTTQIYSESRRNIAQPERELTSNYDPTQAFGNTSFSGADAVATLVIPKMGENGSLTSDGDVIELGELQTISYSIHRENAPVRTLGHVNARGFVKGARTIGGSLIFTVFNEYAFYRIKQYKEMLSRRNGFFAPLADMLPPFDIVVSFFNEYGQGAKMKIFGVTIVDEGQTVSTEDLVTEQTYVYMARGIQPMIKLTNDFNVDSTKPEEVRNRDLTTSTNVFGDQVVNKLTDLYNLNMVEKKVKP